MKPISRTTRVDQDVYDALKKLRLPSDRSLSDVVKRLLRVYGPALKASRSSAARGSAQGGKDA